MLDPADLEDLIALWQSGSLSAAAKRRGVAISTVSRRLDALEQALNLKLIDRQAKGTRLTRQGAEIAKAAEPVAEQLARVLRTADVLRDDGTSRPVRLSATEFVISDILAPALPRLWAKGRSFALHLQSQADVVSLAGRDADLAVRMSRPQGASLIARKLPALRLGFYAARSYLAGLDPAQVPLKSAPLLVYDGSYGRLPELDWLDRNGLWGAIAMRSGSTRALATAAISGAGIAMLAAPIAARMTELVEVPTPTGLAARNPWLLVHRDLRREPAIRQVHAWVIETFQRLIDGKPSV